MDKVNELRNQIQNYIKENGKEIRSFALQGRIVRHFKGDLYLVLDFAENTETGEAMVVYKALYGECKVYARPYNMFNEEVPEEKENPTGQKYRFELYEIESVKGDK